MLSIHCSDSFSFTFWSLWVPALVINNSHHPHQPHLFFQVWRGLSFHFQFRIWWMDSEFVRQGLLKGAQGKRTDSRVVVDFCAH